VKIWRFTVSGQPEQRVHETSISKILGAKRVGGKAQVVQCMPSKREALSLNFSMAPHHQKKVIIKQTVHFTKKKIFSDNLTKLFCGFVQNKETSLQLNLGILWKMNDEFIATANL
jgi:hypothetical protein